MANEEPDTALNSTRVASIKRTIFFMKIPQWDRPPLRNNILFLETEIVSVRKTRDGSLAVVGLPTERIASVSFSFRMR